ncbi:GNAT family protein [Mycoplasmatota bacterium WC44]
MKNISPTIALSDSLILRKPKISDIEERMRYGRPNEFRKMCGGDMKHIPPFTIEEAQQNYYKKLSRPYSWAIEFEGRMIGGVSLKLGVTDNGARYSIGILDESLYSKGMGTKITNAILDFAFNELKLHRVDLVVLEFNHRGIHCYEKCGFTKEGVMRDSILIDGIYYSDITMSILENEYNKN